MDKNINYDEATTNKELFCKTVYTTLSEAVKILEERQKDKKLKEKIEKLLNNNVPEPLRNIDMNGVLFRQIATPNFEARWFIELTKDNGLRTIFFEYHSDKFTSKNPFKHSLGQVIIHKDKVVKDNYYLEEKFTIIDFNKSDGKNIKDINTFKNISLIELHKELFNVYNYNVNDILFWDASSWIKENGNSAIEYYANMLLLFIYHGILFENFLFFEEEGSFTRKILLPAFKKVHELTGLKPIIVPIPPMDVEIENDVHWHSHSIKIKPFIKNLN